LKSDVTNANIEFDFMNLDNLLVLLKDAIANLLNQLKLLLKTKTKKTLLEWSQKMASFRGKLEQHLAHQVYALYDEEDPLAVPESGTFVRVMVFDARKISDSAITIYNDDAGDTFDYMIKGSGKFVVVDDTKAADPETDAPATSDKFWINILRDLTLTTDPLDPANHDQEFFRTVPASTTKVGWNYESFSNKWAWIEILARTAKVGGLSAKITHRGTNQK